MRKANYDRFPSTKISGTVIQGWENICSLLEEHLKAYPALAVDFYTGVYEEEVINELILSMYWKQQVPRYMRKK